MILCALFPEIKLPQEHPVSDYLKELLRNTTSSLATSRVNGISSVIFIIAAWNPSQAIIKSWWSKIIRRLTHWGWVMHICVNKLTIIGSDNGLIVAWTAPSHYRSQCWNIVNSSLRNKLQWNFNRNANIFIQENALQNVVCEMTSILSRPQCVKQSIRAPGSPYIYSVIEDNKFYNYPVCFARTESILIKIDWHNARKGTQTFMQWCHDEYHGLYLHSFKLLLKHAAPTTSAWSTMFLPAKMRLISEAWRHEHNA